MPGHKGRMMLGPESLDITEIRGADSLYEACGIIAESEENASTLFGSLATAYSTEGSTQCVKAMLCLAAGFNGQEGPLLLAARNAHKSFVYGAAFLDARVRWLYGEENMGLCGCRITPKALESALKEAYRAGEKPAGVYVTSPDYLGNMCDIKGLSEVAHRYGTLLLVDNAHGAYLHFLEKPVHPLDLGADICCDSAHKTLPVLTGGAYLHVSKGTAGRQGIQNREEAYRLAKQALAVFGSTSPSYLTLASLDLCNEYLENKAKDELKDTVKRLDALRESIKEAGYRILPTDPLKVTLDLRGLKTAVPAGKDLEYEFYDGEFMVFMFTGNNTERDFALLKNLLCSGERPQYGTFEHLPVPAAKAVTTIRKGILAQSERIPSKDSAGRICAAPTVSCPPAVPVVFPGEEVSADAVAVMQKYNIETISVIKDGRG